MCVFSDAGMRRCVDLEQLQQVQYAKQQVVLGKPSFRKILHFLIDYFNK